MYVVIEVQMSKTMHNLASIAVCHYQFRCVLLQNASMSLYYITSQLGVSHYQLSVMCRNLPYLSVS